MPSDTPDSPAPADGDLAAWPMTAEEHRLEDLKQMAAYSGPIVSFDVREPYYLASCDHCGWVGSSEICGIDSFGDDSNCYCPRCQASGADCGKVAEKLAPTPPKVAGDAEEAAQDDLAAAADFWASEYGTATSGYTNLVSGEVDDETASLVMALRQHHIRSTAAELATMRETVAARDQIILSQGQALAEHLRTIEALREERDAIDAAVFDLMRNATKAKASELRQAEQKLEVAESARLTAERDLAAAVAVLENVDDFLEEDDEFPDDAPLTLAWGRTKVLGKLGDLRAIRTFLASLNTGADDE